MSPSGYESYTVRRAHVASQGLDLVNVMPISDVVIVGGGPAGLLTGWKLARAGHDVTLFEEHPVVGEPVHCTGILAREAFDEFGLEPEAVLNALTTVRFHAPSGDPSNIPRRRWKP